MADVATGTGGRGCASGWRPSNARPCGDARRPGGRWRGRLGGVMGSRRKSLAGRLNVSQCCKYLGALAEPERLRIVQALIEGPKSVGEVCEAVGSPVANTSHHLKQLREA